MNKKEFIDKVYELAQDGDTKEVISFLDDVLSQPPELPQYIVVEGSTREDLQDKLNWFAEDGYKIYGYQRDNDGEYIYHSAVMYLDVGYKNVTNLADVKPQDVDLYLANGWEIASTSISTKFVRMIKRGKGNVEKDTEAVDRDREIGVA